MNSMNLPSKDSAATVVVTVDTKVTVKDKLLTRVVSTVDMDVTVVD